MEAAMDQYHDDDDDHEETLLNLSLAVVTDYSVGENMIRKRKIMRRYPRRDHIINESNRSLSTEGFEGKIFRLLQMREQMLKLDHHHQQNKRSVEDDDHDGKNGLHLIHLLLIAASAVNENDAVPALDHLNELYKGVSLKGDSVQRVVAYFADGLVAKLLTRKSPFFEMIMKDPTAEEEFSAFIDLYRVSPYYQFAHFTANQAIMEAFDKELEEKNNRALHVIDFDISYGFQWPSLIPSLSEKAATLAGGGNNRISLRITGFGRSPVELQETESRLVSFSKGFRNVLFEFRGMLLRSSSSSSSSFNSYADDDELIRRILSKLKTIRNETVAAVNLDRNNWTLKVVHSLKPSVVVLVEQEGSSQSAHPHRSFLSRFMESLHYFAAMFDSLDDCLPSDSAERLSIEKNHLGKEIRNMLNLNYDYKYYNINTEEKEKINNNNTINNTTTSTKNNSCPKYNYDRFETWKARMERHGFRGIRISSKSVIQAKLLLKMRTHYYCPSLQYLDGDTTSTSTITNNGGFRVFERDEGRAISLGWQNRYLLTVSVWQCL